MDSFLLKRKFYSFATEKESLEGWLEGGRDQETNTNFLRKKNRFWPVCPSLQCDAAKIPWDKRWNPNNMPITIISTKHVSQISKVGSKLLRWEEDIMID